MAKSAAGSGTIRKKIVTRSGKQYVFWEARYTVGTDPGTGKQIQRSITGKSQKEVAQKLKAATAAIDAGTYQEPIKLTVGNWMWTWLDVYATNKVTAYTLETYQQVTKNHIKPRLGSIKIQGLRGEHIQKFYNDLTAQGLSGKTVKNISAVLSAALDRAVKLGYLPANPCKAADLPKVKNKEIHPLTDAEIPLFLKAIEKSPFRNAFALCLFCGLREGELLGLSWERIDFEHQQITIAQQLQKSKQAGGGYRLVDHTKSGKPRTIQAPAIAIEYLRMERTQQLQNRIKAGSAWENEWNLVFTNEVGQHLTIHNFYRTFKAIVSEIGRPDARPHDLRHTCATAAIASGADIKSVQSLLGHATAAFTLDKYAHTSEKMKQDTADRLQQYYASLQA